MASVSTWTVVFEDKMIINQTVKNADGWPISYVIDDDSFWNQSKFSDVWAIQYVDDDLDNNDTIEYNDGKPHATWNNANLGDFKTQFIDKWDAAHLNALQSTWDNDTLKIEEPEGSDSYRDETEAEKSARLGARPTSYTSP